MFPYWPNYLTCLLDLEQQGKITRTFRRLDPDRQRLILDAILIEAAEKGPAAAQHQGRRQTCGRGRRIALPVFPRPRRDAGFRHRAVRAIHERDVRPVPPLPAGDAPG